MHRLLVNGDTFYNDGWPTGDRKITDSNQLKYSIIGNTDLVEDQSTLSRFPYINSRNSNNYSKLNMMMMMTIDVESKMKHSSDMPAPRFELRW